VKAVALLEVERLSKSFDGFRALEEVSFAVEPGEFSAVIGPNGAGKTTLFNLLTGHLSKSAGRVIFDGIDITHRSSHDIVRLGMGRAFQRANIFPAMTVLESVHAAVLARERRHRHFVRRARADATGRDRAREILSWVHLTEAASTVAGNLSHGGQKLLDIALALALRPKLLLLDEPTAGMHPEERRETMALVKRLWRDLGMTVLFIEHDMDVVFTVASMIRVLHHGQLVAEGPPTEISTNQVVVEAYLGEGVL
jgi:branched-chain amino acid transport system ATP-binding protein